MAEAVGTVRTEATFETAQFEEGTKRAQRALGGFEAATKRAGTSLLGLARSMLPVVSAAVAAAGAITAFQRSLANTQRLDQLSQATGVTVERLSELQNIADAVGVDFETLARAASTLGTRMTEGLASTTSRVAQAFRVLDVEMRNADGSLRSFDDLLPELADKFAQYADGANKGALAAAIFGEEAGPRLVPLLNQGRAGLAELQRQLGGTVTTEDGRRAREYQRNLAVLNNELGNLAQELLRISIGPAGATIRSFADLLKTLNAMSTSIQQWGTDLSNTEAGMRTAEIAIRLLNKELDSNRAMFERGVHSEQEWKKIQEELNEKIREQTVLLEQLRISRQQLIGLDPHGVDRPPAPTIDPDAQRRALAQAQFAADEFMSRLTGQRLLLDELNTSWTNHADNVTIALAKIGAAHEKQWQAELSIARARRNLQLLEQQAMLDTASLAAQTITALWPKQKGAAIAAAVINTAVAVTKALTSGIPPWNFAQAALVAAAGAAQIAAIRATNLSGGSPAPVSGGGGTGSGVVDGGGSAPQRIVIEGVDPAAIFTGEQLNNLIDQINKQAENGAVVVATKLI